MLATNHRCTPTVPESPGQCRILAIVPRPGRLYYNCIIGPGRGLDTGINTVVVVQLITNWW